MNQISLDFGYDKNRREQPGESHAGGHRLFFALCPPDAVEQQAAAIADDYGKAFSLSAKPRLTTLHVTIIGIDDYEELPEDAVFAARQAGATVESAPITVTFDRIMSFKREGKARPLVLCGEGGRKSAHTAACPTRRRHAQYRIAPQYQPGFHAPYDAALRPQGRAGDGPRQTGFLDGRRTPARPQCSRKDRTSDHRSLAAARLRA